MKSFAALLLATASALSAQQFVTGQGARLVIGQTSFTQQIDGASEALLGSVSGLALANDTLYVVDGSRLPSTPQNNRVLIYRNISGKLPSATASMPWDGITRCRVCGGVADTVLGQTNFTDITIGITPDKMRTPTAVATDGNVLAVSDTDNNRVLIWLSMPTSNGQAADIVIGQPDFKSVSINYGGSGWTPSDKGLRGPQGVWIQNGRLYIADTQNNRVLIYNSIPRSNGASANVVLGAPDFATFVQSDLAQATLSATPRNMLNPVSVTSDGTRLVVTDLGHNRVLIWNSIPTTNGAPVDVVVGQPDATSTTDNLAFLANNSSKLCASNGTDADTGDPTYPELCGATLNFPRYALSDGKRLFIADGGNDRVLVYNQIPTENGRSADVVLGQLTEFLAQNSDARTSAADTFRTPSSLAWDGTNLYVSDPFNRRVVVYTLGDQPLPITGVRNAFSRDIFAVGGVTFSATPKTGDVVTIKVGDKEYAYTTIASDSIESVINTFVGLINADGGDPNVLATANLTFFQLLLTARVSGEPGNAVTITVTFSEGAQIAGVATAPTGGQDAARIAPGSAIIIVGDNLSDVTASAPENAVDLPQQLGGVEVYVDGIRVGLLMVSPNEIRTQMPWEVSDSTSVSVYIRRTTAAGTKISTAIGVPIIAQNPGILAQVGVADPRPALAYHGSNSAFGLISVDGTVTTGDISTVTIEDRPYTYTAVDGDSITTVRDNLIRLINQDERVSAYPAGQYTRIVLSARVPGPEGEGITYGVTTSESATLIVTALGSVLCCSSREGGPITTDDPAKPGELIRLYATGLGFVQPDEAKGSQVTGSIYQGPADNYLNSPVDDALAGGKTANVVSARLVPGMVGVYQVELQLNSDIPTNPQSQLYIAQAGFVSNIVTIPVVNPAEAAATAGTVATTTSATTTSSSGSSASARKVINNRSRTSSSGRTR